MPEPQADLRELRKEALRLFREGRYPESAEVWERIAARSDAAATDWLSVVTSSLMAGRGGPARRHYPEAWARVAAAAVPGPESLTSARFVHFCAHAALEGGLADFAFERIVELAAAYRALTTSDDHRVLMAGLPAFGYFLELLAKARELVPTHPAWPEVMRLLDSGMDEAGRARVKEWAHG